MGGEEGGWAAVSRPRPVRLGSPLSLWLTPCPLSTQALVIIQLTNSLFHNPVYCDLFSIISGTLVPVAFLLLNFNRCRSYVPNL